MNHKLLVSSRSNRWRIIEDKKKTALKGTLAIIEASDNDFFFSAPAGHKMSQIETTLELNFAAFKIALSANHV